MTPSRRRREPNPSLAEAIKPEPGVFIGKFIVNGHRWVWAVSSTGKLLDLKTVHVGRRIGWTPKLHRIFGAMKRRFQAHEATPVVAVAAPVIRVPYLHLEE